MSHWKTLTFFAFSLIVSLSISAPQRAYADEAVKNATTSAQAAEAAVTQINSLNDTLLDVMQNAATLGFDGRYEKLSDVMDNLFDFKGMMVVSIGRKNWKNLNETEQTQLVAAFRKMSISSYANSFDGYSGQSFTTDESVIDRGKAIIVQSQIIRPEKDAVSLNYMMRNVAGNWKIIDVLLSGKISQLSLRRAEFGGVFKEQGVAGLLDAMANISDDYES